LKNNEEGKEYRVTEFKCKFVPQVKPVINGGSISFANSGYIFKVVIS